MYYSNKFKKITLLLSLSALIVMVGCSDKSPLDSNNHSLVGKWELIEIEVVGPTEHHIIPYFQLGRDSTVLEFKSDGKVTRSSVANTTTVEWVANGGQLTFKTDSSSNIVKYSIDLPNLELEWTDDSLTVTETYERM